MKKQNLMIALAAGTAVGAAVTYSLLSPDVPKGASAVEQFDIDRYLGKWHEIARMPSWIERDLYRLTEEYLYDDDGAYKVITKAYNIKKNEWKQASGKLKFNGPENSGKLKVSYLGPLYLAYNVLAIDADYQYALVSGSSHGYLWILSRQPTIPDHIKSQFLATATDMGFETGKLEWV